MPATASGASAQPSTSRPETDTPEAAAQSAPPLARRVGPFTVRAGVAQVEAVRRATFGSALDKGVPFTFPVCWFAHPRIRAAGADLVGGEPWVPIHESQSFDYSAPLEVDVDYQMMVEIIRESSPSRLILRGEIGSMAAGSSIFLRMEMTLRIIPTSTESPT